jgi:P pilus assembly chaperone PapD
MNWTAVVCAMLLFFSLDAQAVVALAGTRLVFEGRYQEASIELSNPGDAPVLIQAWLKDARAEPVTPADLPFVVTPHLAQLPGRGKQTLRILYEGVGMPSDRESMLHLYVLEVPRRSEARQQLSIAVRQRINVFYRPKGLPGDPAEAAQRVAWQWTAEHRSALWVRNPTPFHVSLHNLAINGIKVVEDLMLEPLSQRALALPAGLHRDPASGHLSFKALTDYGGQRDFCGPISSSEPFTARLQTPGAHSSVRKC